MYNFIKKAFNLEKHEEVKTNDIYLKSIILQAEKNCNEKNLKHTKEIINAIIKKDKKQLKDLCVSGIPDEVPLLRTILWKINLKFLDLNVENWSDIISKKRSEYNNMKEAFMLKIEIEKKIGENNSAETEESKDSSNKTYSKNNNLNKTFGNYFV